MTQSQHLSEELQALVMLAGQSKAKGQEERFEACLKKIRRMAKDPGLQPVLRWSLLYLAGDHDAVLDEYERFEDKGSKLIGSMAASIHFARHEPDKAADVAHRIRNEEQRRLRQKTAALWPDLHKPLAAEPRVHLLVLTFNRAHCVEHALRELGKTQYRNYAVYIADNGSTDGTETIIRRAREWFPEHVPVHVQHFPTNIGRPAGHNWLLTGHDHGEAEFVAIGDDDLIRVPPDWLTRMVQTARAFPGCGCVGGKALTPGWPLRIHGGVRNLQSFGPQVVQMTNDGEWDDVGQQDYVDIVDHVIGCLHIFDRKALDEVGVFDIRFSPCQFVDIEHHLRMRLAGRDIIYNGLISFEHLRAMGVAAASDKALGGNSTANNFKLLCKYEPDEVNASMAAIHRKRNEWLGLGQG